MTEDAQPRSLPSLRRYLLMWFAGCAIVTVFAYTQLLEYYLELGIEIRTQSSLERTAEEYAQRYARMGPQAAPPAGPNLAGYLDLSDIPAHILSVFRLNNLNHGEARRYMNLRFKKNNEKEFSLDTGNLCLEVPCELIFLYAYEMNEGEWLYLLHGIVGSEEIYEELEFTEQFAFAIGSLFAGSLLLVAILLVRNIHAPLQKLNDWSAAQSADNPGSELPDLRFEELDLLAKRIQIAFERMRAGVVKEKLFLRHASHELRTPIAILSSNVELIDRLTHRADRTAAEQAAFVRQYRALDDVQLLMETLLWLNRQSDNMPKSEHVDLRSEMDGIVEHYRYLLDERDVSLNVTGGGKVHAPAAAVRMVLSNLVRNAFQYTVAGEVRIVLAPAAVSIENATSVSEYVEPDEEYGFGLGLELVALICARLEWSCTTTESPHGRSCEVAF